MNRPWVVLVAAVVLAGAPARAEVLTEADAIQEALEHSPALAGAVVDVKRAEAVSAGEDHRRVPTLLLSADLSTSAQALSLADSTTLARSSGLSASADLTQTLVWGTQLDLHLDGARQWSSSAQATGQGSGWSGAAKLSLTQPLLRGSGRDIVEASLRQARLQAFQQHTVAAATAAGLVRDVVTAYWELVYAQTQAQIDAQQRDLARAQRDDALARVETGGLAPVEALSFETKVATLEEELAQAHQTVAVQARTLARLLGRTGPVLPVAADPEPAVPPVLSEHLSVADAPPLQASQAQLALVQDQERVAGDALRPRLDATGSVQTAGASPSAATALGQLVTLAGPGAQVGLTLELPLDRTRERMDVRRAALATQSQALTLEATRQQSISDLGTLTARDAEARSRAQLAAQTLAIAEKQLSAEQERFRTGGSTALQVRTAEDDVRSARLRRLRALVDLVQIGASVEYVTGQALQARGVTVGPEAFST